jgi:DNA repair photolyase
MPTLNLTAGCAHGCLYCYTRGYSTYPGEQQVHVYANTLVRLREELQRKRKTPLAVYFSPSSDLFQPVPEVLDLAYEVMRFLFERGIGVAFLTKGAIPDRHMALLRAHPRLVRAQMGLTTLDAGILHTFEPNAAHPEMRLEQTRALVDAGIPTEVRLDPILPGITDTAECLHPLCRKIAATGVRRIALGVLFLRPAVLQSLKRHLGASHLLFAHFEQVIRLSIHAERSVVFALPSEKRRLIYERVGEIAQQCGINIAVCGCKNPDLRAGTCNIAGTWPQEESLFQ